MNVFFQPLLDEPEILIKSKREMIELFYQEHSDAVYRYALVMTGSTSIAEEVTQDTFLFAFQNLAKYDESRSASALGWLFGILRNKVRHALVYESRVDLTEKGKELTALGTDDLVAMMAEARDTYQSISELKIEQREVIVLCGLLEVDYVCAAQILDIPVGTVRSRLFRARKKLDESMNRCEQGLRQECAL